MSQAVTIDNYDVKTHQRYAIDQATFEPNYILEAQLVAPHLSVAVSEWGFTTKWEELFETHIHHQPWAVFSPPDTYNTMRNRFFSHALSTEFDWAEETAQEDSEEKDPSQNPQAQEYKNKIKAKQSKSIVKEFFKEDQEVLLKLIDSIQMLNGFLKELHGKKFQYQKG